MSSSAVNRDTLAERARAIRWFHTMDLGQGVQTDGITDTRYRLNLIDMPESLSGLTVLDVGAWDGFFSFEAERRGAKRVVASDHYSWHGVGWGTGNGKAGFELAREALGSHVEDRDIDVMDLSPDTVGVFDVVLFLGVLYHLQDPLGALARVASVTGKLLILESAVDMVGLRRPAAAFYPGRELNNDPSNWWGPNHAAVVGMLRHCGFKTVDVRTPPRSAPYRAARAIFHKIKGKNSLVGAYRQDRGVFHAYKE